MNDRQPLVLRTQRRARRGHAHAEPADGLQRAVRGMLDALQAELDARGRATTTVARRGHRRRRQGLLRRPRPEGDARRAVAGLLPAPVRAVRPHDDGDPAAAGAGDRARARHRHRGRLPAGGDVRPGGGRARRALRRQRHQRRPVLLDAERGLEPQPGAQGGLRDAGHRRVHRCRRGAGQGPGQPRRRRRARWMPRSKRWWRRSSPSRAWRWPWASSCSTASWKTGIEAAYADAEATMACNMMEPSALEGVQAFIDKRPPRLEAEAARRGAAPSPMPTCARGACLGGGAALRRRAGLGRLRCCR